MIKDQSQFNEVIDKLPEWRRIKLAQALRALAEMPTPKKGTR